MRLPMDLAENRQVCSRIPPSKKGVGLCLILLLFQSLMASLVEGNVHTENIKV